MRQLALQVGDLQPAVGLLGHQDELDHHGLLGEDHRDEVLRRDGLGRREKFAMKL